MSNEFLYWVLPTQIIPSCIIILGLIIAGIERVKQNKERKRINKILNNRK